MAIVDGKKRCSKCGEWKDVGEFSPQTSQCKVCKSLAQKKRYASDPEKYISKQKKYAEENHEKVLARYKAYNGKHREERMAYDKYRYHKNIELSRLRANNWTANNKKKRSEYTMKNIERITAVTYFSRHGLRVSDIQPGLLDAKMKHIELIRAIKAQKESHKEI